MKPASQIASAVSVAQCALNKIAQAASALVAPSTALFYECHQENRRAHAAEVAALEAALEQARMRGFAAAIRLQLLTAPLRPLTGSYTDIAGEKGGGQ